MADENQEQEQQQQEPQQEPQQPDIKAQIRQVLDEWVSERQQQTQEEPPRQPAPTSLQGIAALEAEAANNPAAQVILDMGAAINTLNNELRAVKERQRAGPRIAPERLAEAEAEYATNKYASLEDADAAVVGRKVLAGQYQTPRPQPKPIQTAIRSAVQVPRIEDLKEITPSEWKAALEGPDKHKYVQRYREGNLKVVRES
jgi:hypothetical protein